MKRFFCYAATMPFLLFYSCQEEEILNELTEKGLSFSEVNDAITRSAVSVEEYQILLQTDLLGLLISRIEQKEDSTYVLNLSQEDARTLNIPDSLYVKAVAITNSLNHPDENE